MKNLAGELTKAWSPHPDEGPKWHVRNGGRVIRYIPASLVAQVFLGGSGGRSGVPDFKNGDATDWRASNLITQWSAEQDEAIMSSVSCRSAAIAVGRGRYAVQTRARALGKIWPRTMTMVRPLADRLESAQAAIKVLERAGIADTKINFALAVDGRKRFGWGGSADPAAQADCLKALHAEGWTCQQIGEAFGFVNGPHTARQKLRDLGLIPPTGYAGATRLGYPDPLDGEEWRQHPWGYWVSSLGRVAGKKGLLSTTVVKTGVTPSVYINGPDGRGTTVQVARLMLSMFRPDLPYSPKLFLNGDPTDVRLSNIKTVGESEQSIAQIRKMLPRYLQPADRSEAEQAAIVALMEGRATTPAEAVKIGVSEMHQIAGTKRSVSLDAEISPGASGHDFLMDDGSFTTRERAQGRSGR